MQSSVQSNFTFLSLKRNPVHIFIHSVFSILNPLKASTNLFLSVHSCLFWIFYINVIIQFVVSVTVFFSLGIMFQGWCWFFLKHYLFIYFWLHWIFIALCGFSLVSVSEGYSSLQYVGFSLQQLLLWSMGSRHASFSSTQAQFLQLEGPKVQAQ